MLVHKITWWFFRKGGGSLDGVVIYIIRRCVGSLEYLVVHKKMCWFIRILGGSLEDVVVIR